MLTVAALLVGCEKYHPLHDGQKFRAYHEDYHLIEGEGRDIYVPLEGKSFNIELSGGLGKNHSVTIEDPEYLEYIYFPGRVSNEAFFEPEIIPDAIMLSPKKLGKTKMTIRDEDTGEEIKINVNICEAYKALAIYATQNSFEEATLLCFKYGGPDNVVRFCKGYIQRLNFEHITDGTYAFVKKNDSIYMELTFPADEFGQPSPDGSETYRKYKLLDIYGYEYTDLMSLLQIKDLPVQTKMYYDVYYRDAMFLDVTEDENADPTSAESKCFYCYSASIVPWFFDYMPAH